MGASQGHCPLSHSTNSKWNHHFTLSSSFSPSWLASIFSSNFTLHSYCLFGPPLSLPNVYIYTYTHTHSVQSLSHVQLFATPWTAACQASLSITNSQSLCKLMFIKSVMPSNHLILCRPLLLPPLIFPSIRVFSNESVLHIKWPKYWSWSFGISSSNEYSGLISFGMDWIDLLTVQGTLKSLLQHHSSKAPILHCSAFFIVQLSHPHLTTWLLEKP